MITLEGYITAFEITSASTHDRRGLLDIIGNQSDLVILDDKGYVRETLIQDKAEQGVCLMALKPSNNKTDWSKTVRKWILYSTFKQNPGV